MTHFNDYDKMPPQQMWIGGYLFRTSAPRLGTPANFFAPRTCRGRKKGRPEKNQRVLEDTSSMEWLR